MNYAPYFCLIFQFIQLHFPQLSSNKLGKTGTVNKTFSLPVVSLGQFSFASRYSGVLRTQKLMFPQSVENPELENALRPLKPEVRI